MRILFWGTSRNPKLSFRTFISPTFILFIGKRISVHKLPVFKIIKFYIFFIQTCSFVD